MGKPNNESSMGKPTKESSMNGERSDRRTGRTYECMNARIDLSISQPINKRTNGPVDGPFIESPVESPNE